MLPAQLPVGAVNLNGESVFRNECVCVRTGNWRGDVRCAGDVRRCLRPSPARGGAVLCFCVCGVRGEARRRSLPPAPRFCSALRCFRKDRHCPQVPDGGAGVIFASPLIGSSYQGFGFCVRTHRGDVQPLSSSAPEPGAIPAPAGAAVLLVHLFRPLCINPFLLCFRLISLMGRNVCTNLTCVQKSLPTSPPAPR